MMNPRLQCPVQFIDLISSPSYVPSTAITLLAGRSNHMHNGYFYYTVSGEKMFHTVRVASALNEK